MRGFLGHVVLIPGASHKAYVHFGGPNYAGGVQSSSAYDQAGCSVRDDGTLACGSFTFVASTYGQFPLRSELRFRYATYEQVKLEGKIASTCLQASSNIMSVAHPITPGTRVEEQVALLTRWWRPL